MRFASTFVFILMLSTPVLPASEEVLIEDFPNEQCLSLEELQLNIQNRTHRALLIEPRLSMRMECNLWREFSSSKTLIKPGYDSVLSTPWIWAPVPLPAGDYEVRLRIVDLEDYVDALEKKVQSFFESGLIEQAYWTIDEIEEWRTSLPARQLEALEIGKPAAEEEMSWVQNQALPTRIVSFKLRINDCTSYEPTKPFSHCVDLRAEPEPPSTEPIEFVREVHEEIPIPPIEIWIPSPPPEGGK